jgi:hypothetical protein
MPVGTRNTSPEQMAANLAAYKAKVAAKIEARKARATSAVEVDELSSLLSRVSMSSSVDDLDDLMKGLSMGGRRRTRKHKGKKRGGQDPCDDLKEQVKELEEGIARRDRQLGRRGGTRKQKKHSRKTRKTRRGGVEEAREILAAKKLRAELDALKSNPTATPAQIAELEKEYQKADNMARLIARMQGSERFRSN